MYTYVLYFVRYIGISCDINIYNIIITRGKLYVRTKRVGILRLYD